MESATREQAGCDEWKTTHLPLHSFQIPSYLKVTKKSPKFRPTTDASKALFIKVCNTWLKVWTYCPSAIWKVYVQQKNPCCSSQKWICGVKKLSCAWCIARCQSCWLWMFTWRAGWPSGQRVGLAIRRSQVRVPLWPLAGFVLGRPEFKFSATLVNSQLVAFCQLGFLILLCCIWIICF